MQWLTARTRKRERRYEHAVSMCSSLGPLPPSLWQLCSQCMSSPRLRFLMVYEGGWMDEKLSPEDVPYWDWWGGVG